MPVITAHDRSHHFTVHLSDKEQTDVMITDVTPFDPGAFASRQSYVAAPALRSAALL